MPRRNRRNRHSKKVPSRDSSVSSRKDNVENDEIGKYNYKPKERVDVSLEKNGDLLKEVIKPGSGKYMASKGSRVSIHYSAFTNDGVIFYDTKDLKEPRCFTIGDGKLVKGIDVGVTTMRTGEVAIFTANLKYYSGIRFGPSLRNHYLNNSPLPFGYQYPVYFAVELISVEEDDIPLVKDGGIQKRIIERGEGSHSPTDGTVIQIYYTLEFNCKTVEEKIVEFVLGSGKVKGIPRGIEIALRTFKLKEKSCITLSPQYAWGLNEKPRHGIPADKKVTYFVKLNRILETNKIRETTITERFVQALWLKVQATNLFEEGQYPFAAKGYIEMLDCLNAGVGSLYLSEGGTIHSVVKEISAENKAVQSCLLLIGHLNVASCFLKMGMHLDARRACDEALNIDPKNEKALYRRGMAYMGVSKFKNAIEDFEAVLKVNPKNSAAENNLKDCKEKITPKSYPAKEDLKSMFW